MHALATNRRCPESRADVVTSNNTLPGTQIVAALLTDAYRTDIDCVQRRNHIHCKLPWLISAP